MAKSFEELKQKYQGAISLAKSTGHLENVNMEGEKLFIRGEVANADLKNAIWNEIKKADPQYSDLTADIIVNPALPQPAAATSSAQAVSSEKKYTVQPGDTLSKIAEKFYGKASEYNRIFEANKNRLRDADHIRPGQELVIPG